MCRRRSNGIVGGTKNRDLGTPQVAVWGQDLVLPRATNAVLPVGFKAAQGWRWDVMVDSVKGRREVEKEEDGGTAGIRGHQELMSGSEESCLSAVGGTETRLEFSCVLGMKGRLVVMALRDRSLRAPNPELHIP